MKNSTKITFALVATLFMFISCGKEKELEVSDETTSSSEFIIDGVKQEQKTGVKEYDNSYDITINTDEEVLVLKTSAKEIGIYNLNSGELGKKSSDSKLFAILYKSEDCKENIIESSTLEITQIEPKLNAKFSITISCNDKTIAISGNLSEIAEKVSIESYIEVDGIVLCELEAASKKSGSFEDDESGRYSSLFLYENKEESNLKIGNIEGTIFFGQLFTDLNNIGNIEGDFTAPPIWGDKSDARTVPDYSAPFSTILPDIKYNGDKGYEFESWAYPTLKVDKYSIIKNSSDIYEIDIQMTMYGMKEQENPEKIRHVRVSYKGTITENSIW